MNLGIESETLEFKKSTSELKKAMDDISAMLNKHCEGVLYFGVNPNGSLCGQQISASTLDDIARVIKSAIKPMIYPIITKLNLDGKDIIKVEVSGTEIPYSSYGKYFKRIFDRSEDITPHELKQMMLSSDFTSIWENNKTIYKNDIVDKKALLNFYNKSVSCGRLEPLEIYNHNDLLAILGLSDNDYLNNAGYFLFSSNKPTVLKMAVFVSDLMIELSDINRVEGNIYNLIDVGISYIKEHINWRVEFDENSTSRIEIPEIPIAAIREIIVNAFAHANYCGETEHEITITPSFVEIYNPGEFPINYKPEDFVQKRIGSIARNKKILSVLYKSKNVEMQGMGLRKVIELLNKNNLSYEYFINEYGFRFRFYRKGKTDVNNKDISFSDDENTIKKILKENPTSTKKDLSVKSNISNRTVQRILNRLKDSKQIDRIGNNRKGRWIVLV